MIGKITEESMRLIADEIIDEIAENTHFGREDSRAIIQRILEDNGIVEVIPDQGWKHPTKAEKTLPNRDSKLSPSNAANTSRKP